MKKVEDICVLVQARLGSQRVPRKMIRPFCDTTLVDILFEKLKMVDKPKKTKTGQYSTAEDILSYLAKDHPIVAKILEWRSLQKLQSTYVSALPNELNRQTQRVHTVYNQAVAATGRLSSNNPNLQNIPIRTDRGQEIRKAFIPEMNTIY